MTRYKIHLVLVLVREKVNKRTKNYMNDIRIIPCWCQIIMSKKRLRFKNNINQINSYKSHEQSKVA